MTSKPSRPYVNIQTFHYPHNPRKSTNLDNFILDEINAGNARLFSVGLSAFKSYSKQLISQPFEVSKFLIQTGEWHSHICNSNSSGDPSNDSDPVFAEVDYYVDTKSMEVYTPPPPTQLSMSKNPHIFKTLSQIIKTENFIGIFRGLNATCLLKSATGVIQAWTTSLISALCGCKDPQFVDLMHTSEPIKLLLIGLSGCALTAFVLTPIYIIRARLFATSVKNPDRPRSVRWLLMHENWVPSLGVSLPTALSVLVNQFFSQTAPLVVSKYLQLDPLYSPRTFRFGQLVFEVMGIFIRLPLETFASRAQLRSANIKDEEFYLIKPYKYKGVLSNLWRVTSGREKLSSLFGGWRLELVSLIGEWGYDALEVTNLESEQF